MHSKLDRLYEQAKQRKQRKLDKERVRKRQTWEWIKENDLSLTKFLLDAPKGFIANVTIEHAPERLSQPHREEISKKPTPYRGREKWRE